MPAERSGSSPGPSSLALPTGFKPSFMHEKSSICMSSHVHAKTKLTTAAQVVGKVVSGAAKPYSCTGIWGGGAARHPGHPSSSIECTGGFISRPSQQLLDLPLHAPHVVEVKSDKKGPRGASWQPRAPTDGSDWMSSMRPESKAMVVAHRLSGPSSSQGLGFRCINPCKERPFWHLFTVGLS